MKRRKTYLVFDEVAVEVQKRQTDIDAKVDYEWAIISADNSDIASRSECELIYIMRYGN